MHKIFPVIIILVLLTVTLVAQTSILSNQDSLSQDSISIPTSDFWKVVDSDMAIEGQIHILSAFKNVSAGLKIENSSGMPGSSINASYRGNSSILSSNRPLFLLDGMPIYDSEYGASNGGVDLSDRLIDINPNDIESVQVINDSSVKAIHGIRAANGIINIKTKHANDEYFSVTITSTVRQDRVHKLPEKQTLYAQGRQRNGVQVYGDPESGSTSSWGPLITDLTFNNDPNYPYNKNGRLILKDNFSESANINFSAYDFFVKPITYNLDASILGKINHFVYRISGGILRNKGVIPTTNFQKEYFSLAISQNKNNLTFGINAYYSSTSASRAHKGSNLSGIMLGVTRTPSTFDNGDGLTGMDAANNPSSYLLPDGKQKSFSTIYDNPYWSLNRNPWEDNTSRLISYGNVSYQINNSFSVSASIGLDGLKENRFGGKDLSERFLGSLFSNDIRSTAYNLDIHSAFRRTILPSLEIDAKIGFNSYKTRFSDDEELGTGLKVSGIFTTDNAIELLKNERVLNRDLAGIYFQASANYSNIFTIDAGLRNDMSSTLSSNNNNFFSYGIDAVLSISKLFSLPESGLINNIELKFSLGRFALDIPHYLTSSNYTQFSYKGDPFIYGPRLDGAQIDLSEIAPSDNLLAESTYLKEGGLLLRFFKDKLALKVNYFNQRTSNVIYLNDLASSSAYKFIYANSATITNNGLEATMQFKHQISKAIVWDFSMSFTKVNNLVKEVYGNPVSDEISSLGSTKAVFQESRPYGILVGNAFLRNEDGKMIIGADGWPILDNELREIGNPNPNFLLGIQNRVTLWHKLQIKAFIEYKKGGDMLCGSCGVMDYFGTSQQAAESRGERIVFDGVLEDGSPNIKEVEKASFEGDDNEFFFRRYGFGGVSELNVFDASWFRIRNISLSYSFGSISPKLKIQNLRVTLFADNLWLKTSYPGIDPETSLSGTSNGGGFDYHNSPGIKSFGTSISLNF